MKQSRDARSVAALLLVATIIGACSDRAAAQTRRRPTAPAPLPPLPGFNPDMPREAREAIGKQLQQQLGERTNRKGAAFREAEKLKREYAAEVGRISNPANPKSDAETEADTATEQPEDGRTGNPSYDAANDAAALLFHAGLLYLDAERWPAAQSAFETIVERHAESIWALESRLCLFEMAFEVGLDPAAAEQILNPALEWAAAEPPGLVPAGSGALLLIPHTGGTRDPLPLQRPGPTDFPMPGPTGEPSESTTQNGGGSQRPQTAHGETAVRDPQLAAYLSLSRAPRPRSVVAADVYLHAGLLAWTRDDGEGAQRHFAEAFRRDPSPRSTINMLASSVVRRTPYVHTPPAAREGDAPDVAKVMVYADLLQNALQMYRAHRLWEGLLTKRQRDLSPLQRSYALLRRAQARSQFRSALEKQPDLVLKDYEQSRKATPTAPWADQSLLLAGEAAWHLKFDTAAAIALWKTLCEDYPDSGYAPRAAYLTGVVHERAEEWEQAYLAFDKARKKYPNAGEAKLVEDHLRKVTANLAELPTESPPEPVPARRPNQRSGNAP